MKSRLDKLAELTHRGKSYLAAEAINEYLKTQEWQLNEINQGVLEANNRELKVFLLIGKISNYENKMDNRGAV